MTRRTLGRGAGVARSWNAEFTRFPRTDSDEFLHRIPDCRSGGIDRGRRRKFHGSSPPTSCRVDGGGSRWNGLLVCRRAALDCSSFLPARKADSFALSVAAAARGSSGSSAGHVGTPIVESRRGESCGNRAARCDFGGVFQRELYQTRAKSCLCREKSSMASVARSAHWSAIGICVRRRWSARHCASAELFRNGAGTSCGNGPAFWIGVSGDRQCVSLEFWLDQHADTL